MHTATKYSHHLVVRAMAEKCPESIETRSDSGWFAVVTGAQYQHTAAVRELILAKKRQEQRKLKQQEERGEKKTRATKNGKRFRDG